jgi:hypothetical protein
MSSFISLIHANKHCELGNKNTLKVDTKQTFEMLEKGYKRFIRESIITKMVKI